MSARNYEFREAVREDIWLLVGLAGGTGSGKTYTAMQLAMGMAGGLSQKFAVIDSEQRRALHYAPRRGEQPDGVNTFNFRHFDLRAPFRPNVYQAALQAALDAKFHVIMIDSVSHEHDGEGGILDWHDEELDRMAGPIPEKGNYNWGRREACNMAAWIRPKAGHKEFMQVLTHADAHIIVCFRAEQKVEMRKEKDGDGPDAREKMKIVPKQSLTGKDGWIPISEKNLPFELTASFLLTADAPGVPKPIKLQAQHRALFPLDRPINAESGRQIAEWAAGGAPQAGGRSTDSTQHQGQQSGGGGDGPSDETIIKSLTDAKTLQELEDLVDLSRGIKTDANKTKAREAYAASKTRLAPKAA